MIIDPNTLTKRYYTIAEVSKMFDVAKSLLRYWESEFKVIQPRKDRGGVRRYTAKDIEKINEIYDLLKNRGFTIEGARKELSANSASKKISKEMLRKKLETVLKNLKEINDRL